MLAVIPARAGSKALPGKNIAPLLGHPLIAWTIDCARQCGLFERIVVTTDGEDIAAISRSYGAEVVMRPDHLATDTASPKDAVIHAYETLQAGGYECEYLALLQPTSPLRRPDDIVACAELVREKGFDTAATFSLAIPHPGRAFHLDQPDNEAVPVHDPDDVWRPRQAWRAQYHLNGAVYVVPTRSLIANKSKQLLLRRIGAHIMSSEQSIDIDTDAELKFAELLMDDRSPPQQID